jgi:hypothetical protein
MKNSNDTIGNRTRDLPACSEVAQPTVPPNKMCINYKLTPKCVYIKVNGTNQRCCKSTESAIPSTRCSTILTKCKPTLLFLLWCPIIVIRDTHNPVNPVVTTRTTFLTINKNLYFFLHGVHLCVSYNSDYKRRLLPCFSLYSVYCGARTESLYIV